MPLPQYSTSFLQKLLICREERHQLLSTKGHISGMMQACHLLKHHLYRCTIHHFFTSVFPVSLNAVVPKIKISWDWNESLKALTQPLLPLCIQWEMALGRVSLCSQVNKTFSVVNLSMSLTSLQLRIQLLRCFRLIFIFKMHLLLSASISPLKDPAYTIFVVSLSVFLYIICKW